MPDALPERYEAGTLPTAGIAALAGGVRTLQRVGVEAVAAGEAALQKEAIEGLSVIPGIRLYEPDCRGGLVAFTHRALAPDAIARALDRYGVCVRAGYHCAPLAHRTLGTPHGGCVRLSFGYGNHAGDAKRFLTVLNKVLKEEGG
jgi:selenocysteine lyase/cysteine desulfurase